MNQRVDVYRRIAAIQNDEDARDVLDELLDRFGEPPAAVLGLVEVATLRNSAGALGITEIKQSGRELRFYLKELDLELVSAATGAMQGRLAVIPGERSCLSLTLRLGERPVAMMKKVLEGAGRR